MSRVVVKLRKVAGSAVLSVPTEVFESLGYKVGDKFFLDAMPEIGAIVATLVPDLGEETRVQVAANLLLKELDEATVALATRRKNLAGEK